MKLITTLHDIGENSKHAERVLKGTKYDVIQIHMNQGEEITEHHAKVETLIIVRTGKVQFNVEGEDVILTNEQILQMEPFEAHSLKALEETDLILMKIN